jgi:hypothetical protein
MPTAYTSTAALSQLLLVHKQLQEPHGDSIWWKAISILLTAIWNCSASGWHHDQHRAFSFSVLNQKVSKRRQSLTDFYFCFLFLILFLFIITVLGPFFRNLKVSTPI